MSKESSVPSDSVATSSPASVGSFAAILDPLRKVSPVDQSRRAQVQSIIDHKTKPPGSLGEIESLALALALMQGSDTPRVQAPTLIVFAADHGITAQGVSPYPQSVTAQMVANFVTGGAAINAFCQASDVHCEIVDVGVAHALPEGLDIDAEPARSRLQRDQVAPGTADFSVAPAMNLDQLAHAMRTGAAAVERHANRGCNTIAFGEMGIGNTSSAACLMQRFTEAPIADCVGRGTGLDEAGLAHKRTVLAGALDRHRATLDGIADPIERAAHTLATFGGFEVAAMVGAFLAAASRRMTIVVDGFVVSSALLAACALAPATRQYCVFAHRSEERGHQAMLEHFNARPLLHLGLRLGEGTGAALAVPLLRAACAMLCDMASFASAGVDDRTA